ncbi:hypothetical protein, partial [Thaumasiovibrio sp. DFM-14]|uniref:hypothetical protein n=1 Tax=Thaumasiovibrio sp. DFM-14 TaxID=3384792 RepID=UPI0039A0D24F
KSTISGELIVANDKGATLGKVGATPLTLTRNSPININIAFEQQGGTTLYFGRTTQDFAFGRDAALSSEANRYATISAAGLFTHAAQSTLSNALTRYDHVKALTDALESKKVNRAGDTMTGTLQFKASSSNCIEVDTSGISGGWARGIAFTADGGQRIAGMMGYGRDGDHIERISLGFGESPWNNPALEVRKNAILTNIAQSASANALTRKDYVDKLVTDNSDALSLLHHHVASTAGSFDDAVNRVAGKLHQVMASDSGSTSGATHGIYIPHGANASYGSQVVFRNGYGGFRSLENNAWSSWRSFMTLEGAQVVAGGKTFSVNPISTANQSTATNALTRKDYVDTQIQVSMTYTDGLISDLIGGADGAYDTLKKLQEALEDADSEIAAITNELATKVDKSGDVMTGALEVRSAGGAAKLKLNRTDNTSNVSMAFQGVSNTTYFGMGSDGHLYHGASADLNSLGSKIYSTSFKPTNADVGLSNVINVKQAAESLTLTAGDGLTGGGTLAANRTFAVDSTVARLTAAQTLTNKTVSDQLVIARGSANTQGLAFGGKGIANVSALISLGGYAGHATFYAASDKADAASGWAFRSLTGGAGGHTQLSITHSGNVSARGQVSAGQPAPTAANHLTRKDYVDGLVTSVGSDVSALTTRVTTNETAITALDAATVKLTGNQNIGGVKTLTNRLVIRSSERVGISHASQIDSGGTANFQWGNDADNAAKEYTLRFGGSGSHATPDFVIRSSGDGLRMRLNNSGLATFGSQVRTNAAAPSVANDLTRKDYVDAQIASASKFEDNGSFIRAKSGKWVQAASTSTGFLPASNGNSTIGNASWRFKGIYGVLGDFSDKVTAPTLEATEVVTAPVVEAATVTATDGVEIGNAEAGIRYSEERRSLQFVFPQRILAATRPHPVTPPSVDTPTAPEEEI